MKPTYLAFVGLLFSGLGAASGGEVLKDVEPRFRTYVAEGSALSGPTGESGREGAYMEVYALDGDVRLVRWRFGKSRTFTSRDYYLIKGKLVMVVEQVLNKASDALYLNAPPESKLLKPVLASSLRIRPGSKAYDSGGGADSWPELQAHVASLISYYHANRAGFKPLAAP